MNRQQSSLAAQVIHFASRIQQTEFDSSTTSSPSSSSSSSSSSLASCLAALFNVWCGNCGTAHKLRSEADALALVPSTLEIVRATLKEETQQKSIAPAPRFCLLHCLRVVLCDRHDDHFSLSPHFAPVFVISSSSLSSTLETILPTPESALHNTLLREFSPLVEAKRSQRLLAIFLETKQQQQQQHPLAAGDIRTNNKQQTMPATFLSSAFASLSDRRLTDMFFALLRQAFGPTSSLSQALNVIHARFLRRARINERCHPIAINERCHPIAINERCHPIAINERCHPMAIDDDTTGGKLPWIRQRREPSDFQQHSSSQHNKENNGSGNRLASSALISIPASVKTARMPLLRSASASSSSQLRALSFLPQQPQQQSNYFDALLLPVARTDFINFVNQSSSCGVDDGITPSSTTWMFQFDNKFLLCGARIMRTRDDQHKPLPPSSFPAFNATTQTQQRRFGGTILPNPLFAQQPQVHPTTFSASSSPCQIASTIARCFIMDQHAVSERGRLERFWRRGLISCAQPVNCDSFCIPNDSLLNKAANQIEHNGSSSSSSNSDHNNRSGIKNNFIFSLALKYSAALSHWGWKHQRKQQQQQQQHDTVVFFTCPTFTLETFELLASGPEPLVEYLLHLHRRLGPSLVVDAAVSCAVAPPLLERFAVTRSCRGAVMFGDKLSPELAARIVRDVAETANFARCSHGRVSMMQMPLPIPESSFLQRSPYAAVMREL